MSICMQGVHQVSHVVFLGFRLPLMSILKLLFIVFRITQAGEQDNLVYPNDIYLAIAILGCATSLPIFNKKYKYAPTITYISLFNNS